MSLLPDKLDRASVLVTAAKSPHNGSGGQMAARRKVVRLPGVLPPRPFWGARGVPQMGPPTQVWA